LQHWTPARLIAIARSDGRRIGKLSTVSHAPASAAAIGCGVALLEGDRQSARRQAELAASGYRTAEMALHAAAASLQLGRLLPGSDGDGMRRSATAWMAQQDIRNADRMTALIFPSYGGTDGPRMAGIDLHQRPIGGQLPEQRPVTG
jgi:eukaryotic-like serine/threonine-protein kinase